MLKKIIFCVLASTMVCAACTLTQAARSAPKAQKKTDVISTEFFNVKLPAGWTMPQPVKKQPGNNGISVAFIKGNLAVTITIIKAAADARELAREVTQNMEQSGLQVSEPAQADGLWRMNIKGRAQGAAFFGSVDALSGITLVLGKNIAEANELLKQIKPVAAGLLPASITE